MTSLKLALLWVSAAVIAVCLGMFSTASADRAVAKAAPAMSAPTAAAVHASPQQSRADDGVTCQADVSPLHLGPAAPQATCPSGSAWTCCRCGGCGCRPQHISPANWCAC